MTIGFIGNFRVPYTTENERKIAFEKLGHSVVTFQEDETSPSDLIAAMPALHMLMYSHTHGWEIPGLKTIFSQFKDKGIPTVSAHLDRWAGLARQKDMGEEATWFTEYIFMADASPEAVKLYTDLGLNWHWLKPGVSEKDCYMAQPDRKQYPHDIIFVGSRGYHEEYPWRKDLVDWLKAQYGDRFGHYGNDGIKVVREVDLNTLYASAKVVVGDSCFAGQTAKYWSDRIPETTGRGGFLIHPWVEGIDHKGVLLFRPKSFPNVRNVIDYALKNEKKREQMRVKGFEWTRDNRTYTHLAKEMLSIIESHA